MVATGPAAAGPPEPGHGFCPCAAAAACRASRRRTDGVDLAWHPSLGNAPGGRTASMLHRTSRSAERRPTRLAWMGSGRSRTCVALMVTVLCRRRPAVGARRHGSGRGRGADGCNLPLAHKGVAMVRGLCRMGGSRGVGLCMGHGSPSAAAGCLGLDDGSPPFRRHPCASRSPHARLAAAPLARDRLRWARGNLRGCCGPADCPWATCRFMGHARGMGKLARHPRRMAWCLPHPARRCPADLPSLLVPWPPEMTPSGGFLHIRAQFRGLPRLNLSPKLAAL